MPMPNVFRPPLPRAFRAAALLALVAATFLVAPAFGASEIAERTRIFLDAQPLPGGGELEIVVGEVDPRLMLAPCARIEPFVPPGARLWGRATLGVRCVEGAAWTAYLPVQIKVFAPVLVAARPIPRGATVVDADVRTERMDVTQFPGGVLGAGDPVEGRTAVRTLAAGEPLRRDLLRTPRVVEAGDAVKVVFEGPSFSVAAEGKALSAAGDGESARVAVATGRVLTGVARPGKVIQIQ